MRPSASWIGALFSHVSAETINWAIAASYICPRMAELVPVTASGVVWLERLLFAPCSARLAGFFGPA
jgi:hypothetical protein